MRSSISLGKILGVPVGLSYSWFVIFVILTAAMALVYFPASNPGWSRLLYWSVALVTSLLFFASVLAHELAHSIVSRANGIPVKNITLFIFGGVAQITKDATSPLTEGLIAIVGPLSSLLIGAVFFALWLIARPFSEPVAAMASWLGGINIALAVFNLLPGFPLDGGRVFRSVLWGATGSLQRATRIATLAGQGLAWLLIIAGIVVSLRGDPQGLWWILIGFFLDNAASGSYQQVAMREALAGYKARDLMRREMPSIPRFLTIGEVVRGYVLPTNQRWFLVTDNQRLKGMLTLQNIKAVRRDEWDLTTVQEAMTPLERVPLAHAEDDAATLLEHMEQDSLPHLPVVEDGIVVGALSRDHLLELIRTRSELRL